MFVLFHKSPLEAWTIEPTKHRRLRVESWNHHSNSQLVKSQVKNRPISFHFSATKLPHLLTLFLSFFNFSLSSQVSTQRNSEKINPSFFKPSNKSDQITTIRSSFNIILSWFQQWLIILFHSSMNRITNTSIQLWVFFYSFALWWGRVR